MAQCVNAVPVIDPVVGEVISEEVRGCDVSDNQIVDEKNTMFSDCMLLVTFPCTAFIYEMKTQDGLCGCMRNKLINGIDTLCIKETLIHDYPSVCCCCIVRQRGKYSLCCVCFSCDFKTIFFPCYLSCLCFINCLKTSKDLANANNADYFSCIQCMCPFFSFSLAFFTCTPCLFCLPIIGNKIIPNFIHEQTNYNKNSSPI